MTVLLTDRLVFPDNAETGFIELLHLNASQHSGAVVSIPAKAEVPGQQP